MALYIRMYVTCVCGKNNPGRLKLIWTQYWTKYQQVCMLPSPLCGIVLPSQGKERLNFGQTLKVGLWYHLYVMSFFQWHFCSCYNCYPSNNTAYTLLLYLLIFWYIFYLFIFILIWSIIWPNLIQTWLTMSLAQLQPLFLSSANKVNTGPTCQKVDVCLYE